MTEASEVDEPDAAVAGRCQVLPRVPVPPASTPDKLNAIAVQCYKYGGPIHFAWGKITKSTPRDTLLSVPTTRTCHIEASRKIRQGVRGRHYSLPTQTRSSASCNEGESQWNGSDSVGGFRLLLILCEWNVMSTRRMEKYRSSDSKQEVPFKPWC